jgi:transposase InsO family protein
MNSHKNARLTYARRLELVTDITVRGLTVAQAAVAHGRGRTGLEGQVLQACALARSPRSIAPGTALAIVELRQRRLTQARIAQALGVSVATVSRVLARAGLSKLSDLDPKEPVRRYEHAEPGDMLHIDIKKLGRIERPSHRVTGNRRDTVDGAGWEFLFVAVDDHARIGFTMYADERQDSAVAFLREAVAYYASLGVTIRRVLTDNGSAFRSKAFVQLCKELGIAKRFTRAYRPQTNGKAERFIQSALREWAYAYTYQHSHQRRQALASWIHHYNWHRPHQGIGGATPILDLTLFRGRMAT